MTVKIFTVIGDSYTTGTGGNAWPSLMSVQLRQDGIATAAKVAAEGGVGYITPSLQGLTFGELAARSVQPHDDLVIYFGSTNDGFPDGLNVQAATAAVNDTFAKTRATAPTAKLLVIGPASPDHTPAPYTVELNDILRDQAARVGATFVDALGGKWLQDDPALVGPDRVHPSDAGQRYLADKIEPLVAAQLR
jgi:lysophospholipase L1-like esterase